MQIRLDTRSAVPLSHQMAQQIRRAVAAGQVGPGDRLPSVRDLAVDLLVNPNTVARVYRDLEAEGLLETRRGQGTFVSDSAGAMAEKERLRIIGALVRELVEDALLFGIPPTQLLELLQRTLLDRLPPGQSH